MSRLQHHSGALPAGRRLALVRRPGGLFRGLPGAEDSADGAGRGQAAVNGLSDNVSSNRRKS